MSECAHAVLPPAIESTVKLIGDYLSNLRARYYPFGFNNLQYPDIAVDTTDSVEDRLGNIYTFRCTRVQLPSGVTFDNNYVSKLASCTEYVGGFSWGEADVSDAEAIAGWNKILSTPADAHGNFGSDVICSKFKRNGNGFRCFDKPKPPATKELAIQRYASEYPPDTICAPLKLNSPFQCTRNMEVPATTRLSLSVTAAQAVFALAGIALVVLLRKLQKPSTKTSESLSTDGDLRSLVRKLRLTVDKLGTGQDQLRTGQDQLRTEFRTGQGTHEELIQKLLSKEGGR